MRWHVYRIALKVMRHNVQNASNALVQWQYTGPIDPRARN